MHRRIKEGALKAHTNAIKPDLTDENKKTRLVFCLSSVTRSLSNGSPVFHDMFNVVHIDEKWFYLTKPSKRYYLVLDEDELYRTCKSKKFITKVMFLAAVARPRYDSSGKAKRSSKNHVAGTLETKPILSVTKEVTRSWLIEKVLPAIRSTWPGNHTGPIYIQQDNAKPHIDVNDAEFKLEASKDGFDIRLGFQPPNSPDLNVLDLGFFRAIQSLQEQEVLGLIDELVSAVKSSLERMPSHELNKVFLTLQTCMKEIMKVRGGNNYKIPHIGKGKLERQGNLPLQIECDENLIYEALSYLSHGHEEKVTPNLLVLKEKKEKELVMEEMNSVLSFVEHSYWQSWTVVYTSFFPQPHILDQNTTWFTEFSPPPSAFHLPPDQQVFLFVMKTLCQAFESLIVEAVGAV
ncbi:uncharacterized protein LOC110944923 [Helianthus annuus]|uniref:uncharacterized protein LOC110944923 n=1 Tax=Helianthus annuus TaxID=4232 RepID=UPI00165309BF|nr:uncharacterized protein LOC110944923 [Helianthus annuus]